MTFTRRLIIIFNRIVDFMAMLGIFLIIFILLSVVYEIIMRNLFRKPSIWMIELTAYSLVFIAFLGATLVLRNEGHVKFDLILNRLKPRNQSIVTGITSLLGASICLVLMWYSTKAVLTSFRMDYSSATDLEFPNWILIGVIPFGSFMLFIQFLLRAYNYFQDLKQ